ncbi:MAG: prepilin peptidase [Christensenellales bacterium]
MINFLFVTALAVVAIYDIKEKRIPNLCVLLIAVLAVIDRFISGRGSFASGMFDVLCVSTPLLMIAVITKGAFGGGDVKLMAAGGLFLGRRLILTAVVIAFITAGSYIFVQMCVNRQESKRKTRKSEIAFGPFLCEGMVISLTAGEKLIQWYLGLSG